MCPFLPSWSSSCAAALGTANPWDRTGSFPREERSCGSPVPAQLSGWAAQGRAMLMAHPLPWIYMDLSCPRLELGQGWCHCDSSHLGMGFCIPSAVSHLFLRPVGHVWIFPRPWQGGAAWAQLDPAPVSQSSSFAGVGGVA